MHRRGPRQRALLTSQLAQTTLRSVLGQAELDDLLSERERLNQQLQHILRFADRSLGHQGVGGGSQARGPAARHAPRDGGRAEAEREKRAKIIHAEGELIASEKLSQAAAVIGTEAAP